jgi:hypothetical protein
MADGRLNSHSLPHSSANVPVVEDSVTATSRLSIDSLFTRAQSFPGNEEPSAEQLPSIDRLAQLFSEAMKLHSPHPLDKQ